MTASERLETLHGLLSGVRVAALATLGDGGPYGSMTPFVPDPERGELLIHVSRMARHTRNLAADPRVSLLVCEADGPDKNPLALVRVTICGETVALDPASPQYQAARRRYLRRFPEAEMVFQLPDFILYAVRPASIHLVAGFGKAYNLSPDSLAAP